MIGHSVSMAVQYVVYRCDTNIAFTFMVLCFAFRLCENSSLLGQKTLIAVEAFHVIMCLTKSQGSGLCLHVIPCLISSHYPSSGAYSG